MRWVWSLFALALTIRATTAAADDVPRRPSGISARTTGALVLEADSPRLIAITSAGARDVAHPDVGNLDAIDGDWILGRKGLLHHDGTWKRIELPALPGPAEPARRGYVATLGADRAVVVRAYARGVVVDLALATGEVTRLIELPDITLSRPIPDGRGGFWTIVRVRTTSPDGYAGYVHYDGRWTLYRQTMKNTSSYLRELPPMEVRDATDDALLDDLAPTDDGGAMGNWYGTLYRVAADGTLAKRGSVTGEKVCAIVRVGSGHVAVMTRALSQIAIETIDAAAQVTSRTEIALPRWYARAHFRAPVFDCEASVIDDRLWIASGPFVFERTATGFTTYVSPVEATETERDNRSGTPTTAVAITTLAIAGLGVGGGGAVDGNYGAAAAQTLGGTLGALPGTLFLDVLDRSPCVKGNDSGYQVYNDLACVLRGGGYVLGVAGAGGLGALGTYLVGRESEEPSERAYLGAFAGGSVGAVLSIGSTKLVRRYLPNAGRLARSVIAAALVGSGATIGYQLAR